MIVLHLLFIVFAEGLDRYRRGGRVNIQAQGASLEKKRDFVGVSSLLMVPLKPSTETLVRGTLGVRLHFGTVCFFDRLYGRVRWSTTQTFVYLSMRLAFEYGQGLMEAEFPNNTKVFIPGETVPDPPASGDVYQVTLNSIRNPTGMRTCRHYPDRPLYTSSTLYVMAATDWAAYEAVFGVNLKNTGSPHVVCPLRV
jgi:hypothetical protein